MFSSNLSNYSQGVNTAFIIILSILFFFLIGLTIVLVYFIFRYREAKNPVATQIHGNILLEVIWTVIPLVLVMGMFYYGWVSWKPMESDPPGNSFHIETTARMWKWSFKYPNGERLDSLIVPVGKPIALDMQALDVIHSFYIPAFRLKKDIVPGTKRIAWFIANSPGTYDIFCTEYCGLQHSSMISSVTVLPQKEFDNWFSASANDSAKVAAQTKIAGPADIGKALVKQIGCVACHSTDGSKIVGPSYKGIFGKEELVVTEGKERKVIVDENYLRRSITDPNADILKGFNKGLMLSYKDQLSDEEISKIIEYIKSLK